MASHIPRAALYARVSTDAQVMNDRSLPDQIAAMRRRCAEKGWEVVKVYEDPGYSGTNTKRPAFLEMYEAAISKNPPFDILLAYAIDRFGRNKGDGYIKEKIRENGIKIDYFVEQLGEDDETASLTEAMFEMIGQQYSKRLSRIVPRGQRAAVRQGRFGTGGLPNFGYKVKYVTELGKPKRTYIVDNQTAPYVTEVFRRYAAGESLSGIARWLNEAGAPTPAVYWGLPARGKSHGLWTTGTLTRILRNRRYLGEITYGCRSTKTTIDGKHIVRKNAPSSVERFENAHTPLTTPAIFDSVQERLDENEQTRPVPNRPPNLLHRLARCRACGGSVVLESNGSRYYYFCYNKRRHRIDAEGCSGTLRKEWVDDAVCTFLAMIFRNDRTTNGVPVMSFFRVPGFDRTAVAEAVRAYNESLSNFNWMPDAQIIERRLEELRKHERALLEAVKSSATPEPIPSLTIELSKVRDQLDDQQRRQDRLQTEMRRRLRPLDESEVVGSARALRVALKKGDQLELQRLLPILIDRVDLEFSPSNSRFNPTSFDDLHKKLPTFFKAVKDAADKGLSQAKREAAHEEALALHNLFVSRYKSVQITLKFDPENIKSAGKEALRRLGGLLAEA